MGTRDRKDYSLKQEDICKGTRDTRDYSITGGYLYGNQRQKGLLYNRRISVREPETEGITL